MKIVISLILFFSVFAQGQPTNDLRKKLDKDLKSTKSADSKSKLIERYIENFAKQNKNFTKSQLGSLKEILELDHLSEYKEIKTKRVASKNINNEECTWKNEVAPLVISGESCNQEGQKICSGFISCIKDGKQFTKLATCSEKSCAISAEACKNENIGYFSRTAETKDNDSNQNEIEKKSPNSKDGHRN
jgi:hypothetical protein